MSITKAAIGLMYHIHESEFPRGQSLEFTTIGKALNMRSGKGGDKWDYERFRLHVEGDADLYKFCLHQLNEAKDVDGMEYNDLMYQVLASNMRDVADRFGQCMGDLAAKDLVRETSWDGKDIYFKKAKSWKWEHTKSGEPLGPHGLHMTQEAAKQFGELAKPHVLDMSANEKQPVEGWYGTGNDQFTHYWNGWFLTSQNAYAVGYVYQVIALTPDVVYTQIYEEDWDKVNFIMNIESSHTSKDVYKINNLKL